MKQQSPVGWVQTRVWGMSEEVKMMCVKPGSLGPAPAHCGLDGHWRPERRARPSDPLAFSWPENIQMQYTEAGKKGLTASEVTSFW